MCNINQYKKLKFTDLLEIYNRIVIPAIQRDYAQGREDKKAAEVRKTLLDDIFSDKPEIDFNLVFGSREEYGGKTCFIPVDGQQRLTTLFLLYLYNSKVNGVQIADLNKFTYETRRAAADFCKAIVDNDWENQKDKLSDSIKDCNWFMQYWNQDPTVISMLRMLDDIQKRAPEGNFKEKLDRITFYFYDLKQNGLNETLYIKMNGRGKPLTAFENLKAAIDNILPKELDYDFKEIGDEASGSNFKEKWQFCIDGKWTDAFWDKEKPHDIDKNLTKFIVRFLSGCYAALKSNSNQTTDDETKKQLGDINVNENNYSSFIPFGPIKKVLELENSFAFLARALDIISCKKEDLYPTLRNSDFTFTIDVITEYKALSVLLAYVLFDGDKKAIRFAWNMAENTVSGYNDFINLCRRFGQIKNHSKIREGIYNVLSEIEFDNPSEQLKEEIEKARQILTGNYNGNIADLKGKTWEDVIIEAENYAFFKGAVRFLFRNEKGEWDWKDFDTKWKNAQRCFKKECQKDDKSAVNEEWDNAGLLQKLIKNLFSVEYINGDENKIGKIFSWWWNKRLFNNNVATWSFYLLENYICKPIHDLLCDNNNISVIKEINHNDYKKYEKTIYYLTQTNLLDYVIKKIPFSWIRSYYNHHAIFPSSTGVFLDAENRNKILLTMDEIETISINEEHKIPDNKELLFGTNITFQYCKKNNSYNFRWDSDDYIYLLKDGNPVKDLTIDGESITDKNSLIQELNACIEKYEKLQPEQPTS